MTFIRIGTSGAIQAIYQPDHVFLQKQPSDLMDFLHFYEGYDWLLDTGLSDALVEHLEWPDTLSYPYAVNANKELMEMFEIENFKEELLFLHPGFMPLREDG